MSFSSNSTGAFTSNALPGLFGVVQSVSQQSPVSNASQPVSYGSVSTTSVVVSNPYGFSAAAQYPQYQAYGYPQSAYYGSTYPQGQYQYPGYYAQPAAATYPPVQQSEPSQNDDERLGVLSSLIDFVGTILLLKKAEQQQGAGDE